MASSPTVPWVIHPIERPAPEGSLGSAGSLAARVEVLRDTGSHRLQAAAVVALGAAILALPTLLVVLPWLTGLRSA